MRIACHATYRCVQVSAPVSWDPNTVETSTYLNTEQSGDQPYQSRLGVAGAVAPQVTLLLRYRVFKSDPSDYFSPNTRGMPLVVYHGATAKIAAVVEDWRPFVNPWSCSPDDQSYCVITLPVPIDVPLITSPGYANVSLRVVDASGRQRAHEVEVLVTKPSPTLTAQVLRQNVGAATPSGLALAPDITAVNITSNFTPPVMLQIARNISASTVFAAAYNASSAPAGVVPPEYPSRLALSTTYDPARPNTNVIVVSQMGNTYQITAPWGSEPQKTVVRDLWNSGASTREAWRLVDATGSFVEVFVNRTVSSARSRV